MTYQITDPSDIPGIQRVLQELEDELAQRERAATALANKNRELQSELQRRLAESESVNRVLLSLQEQAEQLAVLAERQRLARELHDSVTQSLYSVTLYANAAALSLAAGKVDVTAGYLQELQETALEGMRDMRLLIFQLHPPVLETEGLVAAMQARLAAVEGRAGLRTEFRVEGERRLPIAIESDLYWIAQEALNNVRKHAEAQHVAVHLHFSTTAITLKITDDGVGFDPQAVPDEERGGLRTIAERTVRMGGVLTYDSTPGKGTRVQVEVAL